MADFGGSDLDAFRLEVRDWLKANYPPELASPETPTRSDVQRAGVPPTIRRSSG